MPFFRLCLHAETEGVTCIQPVRPRTWGVKVECDACRELSPHFVYVDEAEECGTDGGGTRNAVFKCAFCKGTITVFIDPESYGKFIPDDDNDGGVLLVEVRGGTPREVELNDLWVVETAGSTFEGVDLSEEWMEFDEASGVPVSVAAASLSFERAKKTK